MPDTNVPVNGNGNNGHKPGSVNINVPRLDLKLKTNPGGQIILPGNNQLQVDCIGCKGRKFHIAVKPLEDGSGSIRELVCVTCKRVYKVDPNGARMGGFQSHMET